MSFTTLLIDLDETLYPASTGVWDAIAVRMDDYIFQRMGVPRDEISTLRRSLFMEYGTTLRGLQATRGVDVDDFLAFVHDVPLDSMLEPDPHLRDVLLRYPQRKLIFTNADRPHAARVIARLGLNGCFDGIIDIHDIAPYCKPMPEAYQIALRLAGESDSRRCAFLDDSPRNLAGARAAGIYTVQVGRPKTDFHHPPAQVDAQIDSLADLPSVIAPVIEL